MILTDEERLELYGKARQYIAAEQESHFRKEVVDALDEHADDDLYDRFYTSLAFGTAGMRGVIGGGTNRINSFMVRKVSQGLADYLFSADSSPSVVIAYDSRNYSSLFAEQAALTLCANGVSVLLYPSLHPVPMLSYAVRELRTTAGIVITASHNPAKYNGYKVYWSDGGQVTPPHDVGISEHVRSVDVASIKNMDRKKAESEGLLILVPSWVDEAYYEMVLGSLRRPALVKGSPITIAYTPLHGSGNVPVRTLMERLGLHCEVVSEQESPDGDFPTVSMPNPEDPQAMRLAIELAKEKKADIVLGTDPDADRLGIAIPADDTKQSYRLLSGNQIAVLLCDYLISTWKETGADPTCLPLVVKSLVTTDLVAEITQRNGGVCVDVLTGFKYIAEQIAALENKNDRFFLFGCEESFGYLTVPYVRDKDAVSTALCAVEMMSYHASRHTTLQQRLDEIYRIYGYHTETVLSFSYEGSAGKQKMQGIMADFRSKRPGDSFAGFSITEVRDLLEGMHKTGFPKSDVIILRFETGEKLVVRPSGTEPKIKYYLFFNAKGEARDTFQASLSERIARFKAAL
jgi:phosphoglucomutase